ncbi:MarR family winged helix-turn-helix transcriptional regulator [Mycolicibacterium sp.]|uniref:MarR family winged helix-turn-helix transcriptional regulator n=1 Tax=Mycolicibacterium sp. TaxID=2320850 RepID=UPI0037CC1228
MIEQSRPVDPMLDSRDTDSPLSVAGQVTRSADEADELFDNDALEIMLRLYRAVAAVDRTHAAELAPHRLTLNHFQILSTLHRAGHPLPMGDLGRAISVRAANLTGLVDVLSRRMLVRRAMNAHDRRSFLVGLTSEGNDFMKRFLPGHWRYLRVLTSELTTDDKKQLSSLLERFEQSVDSAPPADLVKDSPAARAHAVNERPSPEFNSDSDTGLD